MDVNVHDDPFMHVVDAGVVPEPPFKLYETVTVQTGAAVPPAQVHPVVHSKQFPPLK